MAVFLIIASALPIELQLGLVLVVVAILVFLNVRQQISSKSYQGEHDEYNHEVRQIHVQIREQLADIYTYIHNIHSADLAKELSQLGNNVNLLLEKIAEKAPLSQYSAATVISAYLVLVCRDTLPQYMDLQSHSFLPDRDSLMEETVTAFQKFNKYLLNSFILLEREDHARLRIALKMLDPTEHAVVQ